MQRQRGELVPVGEVIADLPGPVQAIREATPPALHHFTQADQVNQLVTAREADPDRGLHGANDDALLIAPHQPWQPERIQARQRAVHALHDCYRR